MTPDGFWDYTRKWQKDFAGNRPVAWEKYWIENDFCKDCRFCCGPQDSDIPFPMPLLERQRREHLDRDFHLLDSLTPYLAAPGCKACGTEGCRLKLEEKPLACGFFPVVLANGGLYLYKNCPAVIFSPLIRFMELGLKVGEYLQTLDLDELRRLSLWLNCDTLSRSYIDLRISLFRDNAKEMALD
ncbi:MAG: hypothetical protein HDQ91_01800 [Desulfovibrio sp.]|nr:hypothetical protein [Desulfovibrio sp.]